MKITRHQLVLAEIKFKIIYSVAQCYLLSRKTLQKSNLNLLRIISTISRLQSWFNVLNACQTNPDHQLPAFRQAKFPHLLRGSLFFGKLTTHPKFATCHNMKCTRWQFTQADLIENAISTDKLNKRRKLPPVSQTFVICGWGWGWGLWIGFGMWLWGHTLLHSLSLNFFAWNFSPSWTPPWKNPDCYQVQNAQKFTPKAKGQRKLLVSQPEQSYAICGHNYSNMAR